MIGAEGIRVVSVASTLLSVASIFKRVSEPVAAGKYGAGLADLVQTYKVGDEKEALLMVEIYCAAQDCHWAA
jgi:hypothetical protein